MTSLEIAFVAMFAVFAIIGAVSDIRTRKIPNWLNGAFLLAGLVMSFVVFGWQDGLWHLAHFGAALALGVGVFAIGGWGGGDAKFYAAMGAWFPIGEFFNLLLSFALVGGVMAIFYFASRKLRGEKLLSSDKKSREIPYGVALAVGGLLVQGWLAYTAIDPAGQLQAF